MEECKCLISADNWWLIPAILGGLLGIASMAINFSWIVNFCRNYTLKFKAEPKKKDGAKGEAGSSSHWLPFAIFSTIVAIAIGLLVLALTR